MRSYLFVFVLAGLSLSLVACSEDEEGPDGDGLSHADAAPEHDAAADRDAGSGSEPSGPVVVPRAKPAADEFEELVAYDWTLEAGEERYYCMYQTVTEDLWISDFEPISPAGTHHVTLGFVENGPEDGVIASGEDAEFPCTGITLGDDLVYGAVRNTQGFTMPEGVAAKIPAGRQLLLSVHVFNGSEEVLTGHTGIAVVRADSAEIEHEAENIFAQDLALTVPPGSSTFTGTCTMEEDGVILSLLQHMHLTGVRQKTTLVRKNGDREVLLDEPFVFEEQLTHVLDEPLLVEQGDKLEVECKFENPTTQTFTFGESTGENEMCLTSFYRFPTVAGGFICIM